MDCSPTGSSVHRILQARILEWVAIPFSRGSSRSRDWTWVSHIPGRFFTIWAKIWHGRPSLTWLLLLFASTSLHFLSLTLVKTACFSPCTTTPFPPLCWHALFSLTFLSLTTVTWLAPATSPLNLGVTFSRKFCLSFDSPDFVTCHTWASTASGADFYLSSHHSVYNNRSLAVWPQ